MLVGMVVVVVVVVMIVSMAVVAMAVIAMAVIAVTVTVTTMPVNLTFESGVGDERHVLDAILGVQLGEEIVGARVRRTSSRPCSRDRSNLRTRSHRSNTASWHAVRMAPSGIDQFFAVASPPAWAHSFLYLIFACAIRWEHIEHFSITPRLLTVTSGLNCIRRKSLGPSLV